MTGMHLGCGVDNGGDGVVVHVAALPGQLLCQCKAVFLRFVRQHGSGNAVSDCIHPLHASTCITLVSQLPGECIGCRLR